jgi:hypothetical protein
VVSTIFNLIFLWLIKILCFLCTDDSELNENTTDSNALIATWACTITYFSRECMKRFDVGDDKSANSSKLYAEVFVFCLQEIVALAGLIYVSTFLNIAHFLG